MVDQLIDNLPPEKPPQAPTQDSDEKQPPLIELNVATTNRSHCKSCACLQQIEKGAYRVQMPMFAQGRTIVGSFHVECFFKDGLSVDVVTRGGAGKCKMSKKKFEKGDIRVRIACGNAKFGLSVGGAKIFVKPVLDHLGKSWKDVDGASELSKEAMEALVTGKKYLNVSAKPDADGAGSGSKASSSGQAAPKAAMKSMKAVIKKDSKSA